MRFEDLPNLPLHTVGLTKLRETVRAAVTQRELAPVGATGDTLALAAFFAAIATHLGAVGIVIPTPNPGLVQGQLLLDGKPLIVDGQPFVLEI